MRLTVCKNRCNRPAATRSRRPNLRCRGDVMVDTPSMLAKMQELLVHHYNVSSALGREAAARGLGVDPEAFKHPYPGSTNYTFNVVTPPGDAKAEARAIVTDSSVKTTNV